MSSNASEGLRRQLLAELEKLRDADGLASWAQRALPLKNQLSTPDAQAVEARFAARLTQLSAGGWDSGPEEANGNDRKPQRTEPGAEAVSVISKPVRDRDRAHLKFVAAQPCLVCGRTPSDPHHVKFAEQRAMGRKVSDRFTVPICRLHHRELHRRGNERVWWQRYGIEPLGVASALWNKTHAIEIAADENAGTINGTRFGTDDALPDGPNNETNPNLTQGAR